MKNFVQKGDIIDVPAPYDRLSGQAMLVGGLFGVAQTDAAAGETVAIATRGVFDLAKNSAEAWTVGAKLYWDDTNKRLTTTATGNTYVGAALAAAANPSSIGRIRLNGNA